MHLAIHYCNSDTVQVDKPLSKDKSSIKIPIHCTSQPTANLCDNESYFASHFLCSGYNRTRLDISQLEQDLLLAVVLGKQLIVN